MSTMNMLQCKEILNYKRFGSDSSLSDIDIPETAQNRGRTDKYFLYVFIGFILVLISLLIYTLLYSDINRNNGVDNCGNICGQKNVKYDQWNCTGKDMTDKPRLNNLTCEAENYSDNLNTEDDDYSRVDEEYIKNENGSFGKLGWKIALTSFFALGYCIIMVVLFRYATAVVVWGSLILAWICFLSITSYLWINVKDEETGGVSSAIAASVVTLILFCIMIFLHKRIPLVIMLFKESAKAVYDIPLIFFVPVVAMFTLVIIATAFTVSMIYMFTSGILTEVDGILTYDEDTWMSIALFLNIVMAYWAMQFIDGIQYMVISGAISKWYFTPNKKIMGSPIRTSAFIAFMFHLGTVALGSLIISLVSILRMFLKSIGSQHTFKLLEECCMDYLEGILKFFTKNSYIITAMHGTSFLQSGKQAAKLIALNICNTIVLNFTGDFVFLMAHFSIFFLSLFTAHVLFLGEPFDDYFNNSYAVVGVLAIISSYTILGTFQTAVDTIFLCFCEDCLINNGVNKPYAMSRDFMKFIEGSKKVFEKKIREKGLPTI